MNLLDEYFSSAFLCPLCASALKKFNFPARKPAVSVRVSCRRLLKQGLVGVVGGQKDFSGK